MFKKVIYLAFLVILSSCEKTDHVVTDIITYEITMIATIPMNGKTIFTYIKYNDVDGKEVRLENLTTSFSKTISVKPPFNFYFDLKATNDFNGDVPDLQTSYLVKRLVNMEDMGIVCGQQGGTKFGSNGNWNYSASFSREIDTDGCK
jgi:hypothetical protein